MQPVLELIALTKYFPTHRAVDGVSLAIAPGEFFSLLGPSGCGKTTTLRLIGGFEQPTSGDILLNGNSISHLRPYQRDVATVFQNYALFPHLTVAQNLAFGLERRGVGSSQAKSKVQEALELVQLHEKDSSLPARLSGGERQRVALARALIVQPKLLLLDEPLSALDPNLRKQMRIELKNLQRRVGITFLFITHDQEEALSLSDRMALMNAGKVEQVAAPRDLYRKPETKFAAEFLGEINWFGGVGVRPESLRISKPEHTLNAPSAPATVRDMLFLGSRILVQSVLQSGVRCTVELDATQAQFKPGETIQLWWNPEDEIHLP